MKTCGQAGQASCSKGSRDLFLSGTVRHADAKCLSQGKSFELSFLETGGTTDHAGPHREGTSVGQEAEGWEARLLLWTLQDGKGEAG